MVYIGERIKAEMVAKERGVSWLADKLGCSRMAVYRILERNSIDTLLLHRIGKVLNHDFFRELSDDFNTSATNMWHLCHTRMTP